ncbi:sulfite exporter TauE/SafE family protein [Patescibacteria group bacterium]
MINILTTFILGLVLGLKHALEADHLVAVTTLITEYKNPVKAALVGTFWGIGHTTTLFIIGIAVLLLKINIPESVSHILEIGVGVMLVFLGIRVIITRKDVHLHKHKHGKDGHIHIHTKEHHKQKSNPHNRSFFIGMIHGIAGSGALMLLVLATIDSVFLGSLYIIIFGIGSIIGMTVMTAIISLPIYLSVSKFNKVEHWVRLSAGILSFVFGLYIIVEKIGWLR